MPLHRGKSKVVIAENIHELMMTGKYPQKQAVAISYAVARKKKAPVFGGRHSKAQRD